jgi:hypothetical protein
MRTQLASRSDTLNRHIQAFHDLIANPGKFSQTEWTYKHHIGNRSATSAIRLGIIERRNGVLYCTRERIHADIIQKVLSGNAAQRMKEKATYHDGLRTDARTDAFYSRLPDFFTTGTAAVLALELGIPKTTMQRIFRKDKRFYRLRHGTYCKDTVPKNYTLDADFKVGDDHGWLTFQKTPQLEQAKAAKKSIGLIRRFINWLY